MLGSLQKASDGALLIVRGEKGIQDYLRIVESLEEEQKTGEACENPVPLIRQVELRNLLETGEMIAFAALARRESRGSHYRSDYPETDAGFSRSFVI